VISLRFFKKKKKKKERKENRGAHRKRKVCKGIKTEKESWSKRSSRVEKVQNKATAERMKEKEYEDWEIGHKGRIVYFSPRNGK
jgi:hypothetical protein